MERGEVRRPVKAKVMETNIFTLMLALNSEKDFMAGEKDMRVEVNGCLKEETDIYMYHRPEHEWRA